MTSINNPKQRYVIGPIFISTYLPPIQVEIDPAFTYAGNLEFELKGIASVDRHVFVETEGQAIKRLIIFQFEGFLGNNTYTYNYPMTNPIELGGETYNQNTYFFSNSESIARNPGAEPAHTTRFLQEKGFHLPDELMMSRFVRVVGADRRHELIIFYVEKVEDTGFSLAEIAPEGGILEAYEAIAAGLTQRSLQSFRVLGH